MNNLEFQYYLLLLLELDRKVEDLAKEETANDN